MDECSISAPTHICEVRVGQELRTYTITPEDVGLSSANNIQSIQGGDPAHNATMLRELLSTYSSNPATDMICLNAAAALMANEQVASFKEGIKLAQAALQEGKARLKLAEVIECSQAYGR